MPVVECDVYLNIGHVDWGMVFLLAFCHDQIGGMGWCSLVWQVVVCNGNEICW